MAQDLVTWPFIEFNKTPMKHASWTQFSLSEEGTQHNGNDVKGKKLNEDWH